MMTAKEAVGMYMQGEKIKSALIWVNQFVEVLRGLAPGDQKGAEEMIKTMVHMIASEVYLSKNLFVNDAWGHAEKKIELALVMINSGVAYESSHPITQALSHVTSICHQSAQILKENDLI